MAEKVFFVRHFLGDFWHFFYLAVNWVPACCQPLGSLPLSVSQNCEKSTCKPMSAWVQGRRKGDAPLFVTLLPEINSFFLNKQKKSFLQRLSSKPWNKCVPALFSILRLEKLSRLQRKSRPCFQQFSGSGVFSFPVSSYENSSLHNVITPSF